MTTYKSIQGINNLKNIGKECYSFYKYDGSNLRWEWNKKQGFHKYGSRNRVFSKNDKQFGEAIKLFEEKYQEQLNKILFDNFKKEKVVLFTEYFGENSFAGIHKEKDKKELRLFDVHIVKKGILSPEEFLKYFGELEFSAELLYKGKLTKEYIQKIRENKTLKEGVVCKGGERHNLWMTKIKTLNYLEKLKNNYKKEWEDNQREQNFSI